jgi:hypothetical protein
MDEWLHHMRRGDFESAWRISDRVLRERQHASCVHLPRHLQFVWRGQRVEGRRVLVRCYHGLGDTLQFIRYMPLLRERARRVTLWVQPALIPLLHGLPGVDDLLPLHDGAPDVSYDVDLELMELPHLFRTTVRTIPPCVPLRVAPAPLPVAPPARVGLVWRSGDWAPERSIPFAELGPLLAVPVRWYVLQGEPGVAECPAEIGIRAGTTDLLEAARVIRALDLVISVDTMAAHLAGTLGRPVWTLVTAEADWRWMEQRSDSPWYPSMTLVRQARAGHWRDVVARTAGRLARLAAAHRKGAASAPPEGDDANAAVLPSA